MNVVLGTSKLEQRATITLVLAAILVGISIVTDGNLSRALNGIAGVIWFAASAMFLIGGHKRGARWPHWLVVLGLTALVAFLVRPSDLFMALAGFIPASALLAIYMQRHQMFWAKMIPALYLPMHIGTAVIRAAIRSASGQEASIRTEPPPTAALVPLVMVLAAMIGGYIALALSQRRQR